MNSTRQDLILATIRTAVPGAVGYLLAQLVAAVPVVADWIAWLDAQIAATGYPDLSVLTLLSAAVVGLVIGAYYWIVRKLGQRWPIIERWLLGSAQKPVAYVLPPELEKPAV